MKHKVFQLILIALFFCLYSPAWATGEVEKVNIYLGHFLLQSWPQDKRVINMEIDTALPPDTLVFQAKAAQGGLKKTTLEIRSMSGKVIEEISRVTGKEDETEATFIYVLTQKNIRKINETRFRVILDNHQEKDPEVHNVALIFLDQK